MNFIDIHCHILPGIDDGPERIEESLEMARVAAEDGVTHIFATPHMLPGLYDNGRETILNSLDDFRRRLPVKISVFSGADAGITHDMIRRAEDGELLTLGGSGYMLLELPDHIVPPRFDELVFNMRQRGIIPIITHPERHRRLAGDSSLLLSLRRNGALSQVTAMSVTGDFGREVRRSCFSLFEKGLVDFVASDAHDPRKRPPILSKSYGEVGKHFGEDMARKVFFENAGKIVKDVLNRGGERVVGIGKVGAAH